MKLAIIPARGGSKRIPRKNIRPFRGRPILAWSLEAARACGLFDTVMVSTDDDEIAAVAEGLGAEVPFRRSAEASSDYATTAAVILEVVGRYMELGRPADEVCCIYPTAPFVTPADLRAGHELLSQGPFDVVIPVTRFSYPIWRSLQREDDGRIALNWPENVNARSQDLPPAYHDAGQWYWCKAAPLARTGILPGPNAGSILLPETRVQDIDNEEDWILAELKHERLFGR